MTTKRRTRLRQPGPPLEPVVDVETSRIVQHPDGYFWMSEDGKRETGPFASFDDALADMLATAESESEPGESLQEAEDEIGIADWIDPDTREPAEERRPRIEDQ